MTSYLYYPPEEFGFDIAAQHQNIGAWLAHEGAAALGSPLRSDAGSPTVAVNPAHHSRRASV
jgi:hypothetical protein